MPNKVDKFYFDRYRLISELGKGSFGIIYKGYDTLSEKFVAIKVESHKMAENSQLKIEVKIYKDLANAKINKHVTWPKLYHHGIESSSGNSVMIMTLLGPNLDMLLKQTRKNSFSCSAISYFAIKMISLIETFHNSGYVHRDLKPQNFVIDYCDKSYPKFPEVYMIDYGLAKKFKKDNNHAPFSQKKSLKGTVRYSSINTHLGIDQSRRDDMQSLGYILLYMLLGKLPWQNMMKNKDKKEAYHHIMLVKMSTPTEMLVENVPQQMKIAMASYLTYTNSLIYHETPDYAACKEMFFPMFRNFKGNIFG